jgi:hypothetical protein
MHACVRPLPSLLCSTRPPLCDAGLAQAAQLRGLEQYKAGELGGALSAAYLRLDELLADEAHAGELRKLAGDADKPPRKCVRPPPPSVFFISARMVGETSTACKLLMGCSPVLGGRGIAELFRGFELCWGKIQGSGRLERRVHRTIVCKLLRPGIQRC